MSARSGIVTRVVMVGAVALCAVLAIGAPRGAPPALRVAYFYNYMDYSHLDSLAAVGFNRAVIHWITDSLDVGEQERLRQWMTRGAATGVEVVPQWALQAPARMSAAAPERRYTWGDHRVEIEVACPLDKGFWRSALLDRANETLAVAPEARRLAVDLELYRGGLHHYDAGPCRCRPCLAEYLEGAPDDLARDPSRFTGLLAFQEARLARTLVPLLAEFAERHPGIELAFFDLDYDSFVHRAVARALAATGVPTANYCERSYSVGGAPLAGARARLHALGQDEAPLVGGLWLKRFAPGELAAAVSSVGEHADGYFVFTTYSLWEQPSRLDGPYTLQGTQSAYWRALREIHDWP